MAKPDSKQIIVGAASVYVGPEAAVFPSVEDLPLNTTVAANEDVDGNVGEYEGVGFTQEGIEVSYEPDYGDVEVDQLLDSARIFKQSMRVTVNTTLAEATLENLLIVWGQVAESLSGDRVLDIEAGQLGDRPVERSLLFVGPAPKYASGNRERIYHVGRAIQTESSSHALRRSEVTALPVSFRILPGNPVNGKASYGTVRDRATSI